MSEPSMPPNVGGGGSGFVRFFEAVGALLVLAIAALTAVDVFGRYVLSKPVFGGFDIAEALMALSIFWFLPTVSATNSHISLNLLNLRPGSAVDRLRQTVVELCCLGIASGMAVQLYRAAGDFAARNEASLILQIPKAPLVYASATLAAGVAFVHGWKLVQLLIGRGAAAWTGVAR